jgi:hypothetical protein
VIPYVAAELATVIGGVCDLARTVRAAAAFIALEASYGCSARGRARRLRAP